MLGFSLASLSLAACLKSNSQSCSSGSLWDLQNVSPHLHVYPNKLTFFGHLPHLLACFSTYSFISNEASRIYYWLRLFFLNSLDDRFRDHFSFRLFFFNDLLNLYGFLRDGDTVGEEIVDLFFSLALVPKTF